MPNGRFFLAARAAGAAADAGKHGSREGAAEWTSTAADAATTLANVSESGGRSRSSSGNNDTVSAGEGGRRTDDGDDEGSGGDAGGHSNCGSVVRVTDFTGCCRR